ncbi:MAG: DUF393 domain-containing protein [Bacteroidetes bacterium]|nr:DUF393 domain-containing protein [Bacteroidota bacterium]
MNSELPVHPPLILFFDGYCHFCHGSVRFVQYFDWRKRIYFAPLQGETASLQLNISEGTIPESIVYMRNGKTYFKSTAALLVAWDMCTIWSFFAVLLIIPASVRNIFYDWVARNRYAWFGKKEKCTIPTESEKKQYLA